MSFRDWFASERERAVAALRKLDRQTSFVLISAPLLVFLQFFVGSRRRFLEVAGEFIRDDLEGLLSWGWWFGIQGVSGFVVPVLILMLLFRRRGREIGLGAGDWRFGAIVTVIYMPLVLVGTWILSDGADFQRAYPHLSLAAHDWNVFLVYELMFLFYWVGWEYLWRGYVLFGTARTFGVYAILIQTIPFALLHVNKPPAEAVLSVAGGLALGAVVWRCRSFWYAVPVHALQMLAIDLWCTLRVRTGVQGKGFAALSEIFNRL